MWKCVRTNPFLSRQYECMRAFVGVWEDIVAVGTIRAELEYNAQIYKHTLRTEQSRAEPSNTSIQTTIFHAVNVFPFEL